MTSDRKIYKPGPIRGFPEWLPEERLVEQKWFDHIRRVFESYGFCNIETPSVEELDVLTAKGEVDKEIYVIERLHKDDGDKKEARLALHFDQTVPMARYVAMNFNNLVFPFKRYQMQRVWRGERPQMGRMREFYQCDIDVINVDNLPISFDAEVAAMMYEVIAGLDIGKVQLRISNRKIFFGYLNHVGITDPELVSWATRFLDKVWKLTPAQRLNSKEELKALNCNSEEVFIKINNFFNSSRTGCKSESEFLKAIAEGPIGEVKDETFLQGVNELFSVIGNLSHLPEGAVVEDLSIVRGLDYYTGTVYETQLLDVPEFTGSVCSGGRYDDLAGSYINKHLPGVGISLGFSRLFDVIRQTRPELLGIGPKSPAHVLMVIPSEDEQSYAAATARSLRQRGINVELYHAAKKIPDQLKYASRKGIPHVWFPYASGHQVKTMATGEQTPADPAEWSPHG